MQSAVRVNMDHWKRVKSKENNVLLYFYSSYTGTLKELILKANGCNCTAKSASHANALRC